MKDGEISDIVFLMLIAQRKLKDGIVIALSEKGACLTNIMYGRRVVHAGYLSDIFGFVPDESKIVMCCILKRDRADIVLDMLAERFDFGRQDRGVAFTIPINRLSF